ncbi:MAG TPA: hypothetical protein PKZ97_13560 [Azospirillaceae bacterium]|nr:hypothetical protein [Azospirillaceae bacterium]HRQ82134.1 hypothetical protein [Azospirillaceae bacterium]
MAGFDVQALFVALGLSGAAFAIGRVVVYLGEKSLEKRYGVDGFRERFAACAKLETQLDSRSAERAKALKEADNIASDAVKRRKLLERRMADAQSFGEAVVRIIGDEVKDAPCFYAEVVNRYVGQPTFEQREHAYVDSSWAQPQIMEIWARSIAEARAEIERRYPPAFGYQISRLIDIGMVDAMKPDALKS